MSNPKEWKDLTPEEQKAQMEIVNDVMDEILHEEKIERMNPAPVPAVEENTNSTVDDRERRRALSCSYCPPNRKENASRKARHGHNKPKKGRRG